MSVFWVIRLAVRLAKYLFILFVLFFERKESRRRLVWLLVLYFLPGIGIILYVLFSGHIFTATRRIQEVNTTAYNITKPMRDMQERILKENRSRIPNHIIKNYYPLMDMNLNKGDSLLTFADSGTNIYCYGKEFFDDLCAELMKARRSINMEYFIFHSDTIGKRVMDILCQKAREGVEVKLIYDDYGCLLTRTRFFKRLSNEGGQVRPFFQIRLGLPLTLNYRNHRKLTVIDSRIAFIGGINIGDEYANQGKRYKLNWRDTAVRVTGSCVFDMQTKFLTDWYSQDAWIKRSKTLQEAASYFPVSLITNLTNAAEYDDEDKLIKNIFLKQHIPTQVIACGPNEAHKANIEDAFIRMIMSAKKNVYIETPYFTPNEEFYNALKVASYTGVSVNIIIPGTWDKFYMKAASFDFAREMSAEGVKFYLYPGFIHSKMITVDKKISSIGTTNIDNRSFSLHFEENIIFYDEKFAGRCESIFERDKRISLPVDKEFFDRKSIVKRAFWSFCRLFSPLM